MASVREPAVAGTFYPNDPAALSALIDTYLEGQNGHDTAERPKAIIAPHAGYIYSGPIAGSIYRRVAQARDRINRVVLFGPSHRVAFRGMAMPSHTHFRTPLGNIPLDTREIAALCDMPEITIMDEAHETEHSLEVHLPFLQQVIDRFTLIPVVVGDASRESVAALLDRLWGDDETLIVISSDLSHFEPYEKAQAIDAQTNRKIIALDATLNGREACGCRPVNGLLHLAKARGYSLNKIDVRNSGDTAGSRERVVGYGAWEVTENADTGDHWSRAEQQTLLQVAREAVRNPLEGENNYNINLDRFSDRLKLQRATFVTLNINGRLRGCIGSLQAHRPLIVDVANNAQAAAFNDPRFERLTHDEYQRVDIHISVLSEPKPLAVQARADLLEKLRPGIDGLIIQEAGKQATYLPSVWEQLSTPEQFVSELRRKAGLSAEGWSDKTRVMTYRTEDFS
ncbi:MAG: AmmeMemoRadiSam system protein B [Pseudomonadales bacterium]|nr:AmmeMemoRadiSam system protein B [Pseudomonadales bacterium]MBO7007629.1 AmmeMemoRadiSam system protein B [Pseudomonadales bacterium]